MNLFFVVWSRKNVFCKYVCNHTHALSYIIKHCPYFSKEQITYGENEFGIRDRFYHIISRQTGSHLYSNYFILFLKILKMTEKFLGAPLQHQKCCSFNVEVKTSIRCSSTSLGYRDYNDKSHHRWWLVQIRKLPLWWRNYVSSHRLPTSSFPPTQAYTYLISLPLA